MAFAILLALIAALGLAEHAVGGLGLALSLVLLTATGRLRDARVAMGRARLARAVAEARKMREGAPSDLTRFTHENPPPESKAPVRPARLVLGEVCGAPRSGCACRRKRPAEDGSPPYHTACDCREAVQ